MSKIVATVRDGESQEQTLKIDFKVKRVKAQLSALIFPDHEFIVLFIPSLNLTGYGSNEQEATKMMREVVLKDYFDNLLDLPESKLFAELRQYGWTRKPFLAKQLRNTTFIDNERILRDFNLPKETPIRQQFLAA